MTNIVIQDIYIDKKSVNKNILELSQYNLFYLQKKIYQASKACHLSLVQSLQKLLVSLSSVKTLAYIKDKQKSRCSRILISNINIDQLSEFSSDLNVQVRKQIVLWCLQPEWQSKIPSYRISQELIRSQFDENNIIDTYYSDTQVSLKNINPKYILAKLQSIKWISEEIRIYLQYNFFTQCISSKLSNYLIYDKLLNFIQWILFNGIDWNLFRQTISIIKKRIHNLNFFKHLKKRIYIFSTYSLKFSSEKILLYLISDLNFTTQSSESYNLWNLKDFSSEYKKITSKISILQNELYRIQYKKFFQSLRDILFHKDQSGRSRINTNLSLNIISHRLNYLIYEQQISYFVKYKEDSATQINKRIHKIVYRWIGKKL